MRNSFSFLRPRLLRLRLTRHFIFCLQYAGLVKAATIKTSIIKTSLTRVGSLKLITTAFVALLLSACETELPQSQIRIVGAPPPATWYLGSPFSYTFGLDGGSGVYQVRYSKTPPAGSNFEPSTTENFVDMQVEINSGPKSEFTLFGTPTLADPQQAGQFDRQEFDYYITVTDGNNTRHFRYTVGLELSTLSRGSVPTVNESSNSTTRDALRLLDRANVIEQNPLASQVVCETLRTQSVPESISVGGREAGYTYWQIELRAPVGSRTEVFYRTQSRYNESLGELDAANEGIARPNVDFIATEDSVVFQPGERYCTLRVAVFNDKKIEARESFELEFYRIEGDPLKRFVDSVDIDIISDDQVVSYQPERIVLNRGDAAGLTLSRAPVARGEVEVLVSADASKSTLPADAYQLLPLSGVLAFDDQVNAADISLVTSLYALEPTAGIDPRVQVSTSVDAINELDEKTTFIVNEWGSAGLASEVLAREADGERLVDIASASNGLVFTLGARTLPGGISQSELKAYYRNALPLALSANNPELSFAKAGLDVQPIALAYSRLSTRKVLAVALEVNGRLLDAHYGGSDFAIYLYEVSDDGLTLLSSRQFGSELDDDLVGIAFDDNLNLYAYGNTSGRSLAGAPAAVLPQGGVDGFVYKIGVGLNDAQTIDWARFIGSTADDRLHGLSVGNSRLVAAMVEGGALPKLKYYELSSTDPQTSTEFEGVSIDLGAANMTFSDIVYEDDLSEFYAAASGPLDIARGDPSENASRSINLVKYAANGALGSDIDLATAAVDEVRAIAQMPSRDELALLGSTLGQFSSQQALGQQDLVFASYDSTAELRLKTLTQFGTAGVDRAIDLEVIAEDKYLVLWSEDSSAGDGSLSYRVSAFSPSGAKLGPNP